jgi:cholesterol oxidase
MAGSLVEVARRLGVQGVDGSALPKVKALQRLDAGATTLMPLSIAQQAGPNAAGVMLEACTNCGNCLSGCNVGAKDSLDLNLLREARSRGVRMVCGASLLRLERSRRRWRLQLVHTDPAQQARRGAPLQLLARQVVLAAGSLGSTEILLRSRSDSLAFSARLGMGFSGNGDSLGFAMDLPEPADARADEHDDPRSPAKPVGPTISGAIQLRPKQGRPFWVQEFAVPGALRRLHDELATTLDLLHRLPEGDCSRHGGEAPGSPDPLAVDERPAAAAWCWA